MEKDTQTLIDKAKSAMDNAYCPYSRFAVGCVLVTESGKEYTGCNIENASYGATLCAERVALGKAVSEGERKFSTIVLVSNGASIPVPCGICRQVLGEFSDLYIVALNVKGDKIEGNLSDLFPLAFNL
ncbi:MAG: cytidine deaminase [Eubacteriales bacterium]|nr:cytidine deaminase [Eubacteriales bacterium]